MGKSDIEPFIFISYSRYDTTFVERLNEDLHHLGIVLWIDKEGLEPGTPDWEESLREAIRKAEAVLFVASPNSRNSRYVKDELRLAEMYGRRVYPVWIAGEQLMEAVPMGMGGTQYIDLRGSNYPAGLTTLEKTLKRTHAQLLTSQPEAIHSDFQPRNPYKGLRAFTGEDTHDFFGRDTFINELTKMLNTILNADQSNVEHVRLLAIVGPSGSGKSSVVMAGLLPHLRTDQLPGSKDWVYLDPMMPGTRPVESLASALYGKLGDKSNKTIREDLDDESSRGLHLLARHLAPGQNARVLLFVDQFEELFTQTISEDERQQFIALLVAAITEPHGPVIVVLTLRADFYDRPMQYPELSKLLQTHHTPMLPMEVKDLRAAIERPAQQSDVRLTFEGDLVGDLLFDIRGQVGALPLLQFTLEQLYQKRSGLLLTLNAYNEIGGVTGALTRHAEDTYSALPSDEQRNLARVLFLRLADPGTTEQDTTRRRAALSELVLDNKAQTSLLQKVTNTFINARLLTTNSVTSDDTVTTTIEISHEALLREWDRLAKWLREAREDIRLQKSISEAVTDWERRGKPKDLLYRGSKLREARRWATHNIASSKEASFLRTSSAQQRRRIINMVLIALLLAAIPVGLIQVRSLFLPDVTNLNDDGTGSLRQAIVDAKVGGTITFDESLRGTIVLKNDDLTIAKSLTISGPKTGLLAISSIDGRHKLQIDANATVIVSHLVFKGSQTIAPVSIVANRGTLTLIDSAVSGGAFITSPISNSGTLMLVSSTVFNNTVTSSGGGIYNSGTLTLTNSTVSANQAAYEGGGIANEGTLTLTNSTISGNKVVGSGGGIVNINRATLTLINSTISDNNASSNGGGIFIQSGKVSSLFCDIYQNIAATGGGIAVKDGSSTQVDVRNSIVAVNHASTGPDIAGSLTTNGYNLFANALGATIHDPLHKHSTNLSGNSNLLIDPILRNNGGQTQTHALFPGSSAIDQVPLDACHINGITTDQRGVKRPQGSACDIGSYEYQSPR